MMTATLQECAECGNTVIVECGAKLYGNGLARCHPKCVRKYERRLNARRDGDGKFVEKRAKVKGL